MKLLVTGALGHIGSRFIRHIPSGMFDRVYLIDDLSTQRYASLFNLPVNPRFDFVQADILTADLNQYCADVDVVLHLAALTDAESSVHIADKVEKVNFEGSKRVAEACAAKGAKLIFISTTSIYGVQESQVDEECPASNLKPQSPYAESKLRAEMMLHEMGKKNGLDFVICRFGTIFGCSPGMRFHTAINKFCWQAVMNQPITVWKTALHQHRPYLAIDDAVSAVLFLIREGIFDKQVYNVLTVNKTVNEIIEVIRLYIPNLSPTFVDAKIMNQLSYFVLNKKIQKRGFQFQGSLEEGIKSTIDLLKNCKSVA